MTLKEVKQRMQSIPGIASELRDFSKDQLTKFADKLNEEAKAEGKCYKCKQYVYSTAPYIRKSGKFYHNECYGGSENEF